jgi:hypothetical protein
MALAWARGSPKNIVATMANTARPTRDFLSNSLHSFYVVGYLGKKAYVVVETTSPRG